MKARPKFDPLAVVHYAVLTEDMLIKKIKWKTGAVTYYGKGLTIHMYKKIIEYLKLIK